jgi:prepilin-type N-terminal cleavage/methylation domain-containing protein
MKILPDRTRRGVTLIECILVVAILAIFVVFLMPERHRPARASRINCVNNLHQVGLAYRQWALDHNGRFPMQESVTNGGTIQLVERGEVWLHFQVMSNELSMPKILVCPADKKRSAAPAFSQGFGNANVSYFVGVDADRSLPQMLLTGDRNLTNHLSQRSGLLTLTSNDMVGWTQDLHDKVGNVGLTDGSVQQLTRNSLMEALRHSGTVTNRLAIP